MTSNFFIPDWPAPSNIKSIQTRRADGFSEHPYKSFNLATHVNDDKHVVTRNRNLLNQYLPAQPVWLNQSHGIEAIELPSDMLNGDAAYTFHKNTICAVQTADCLPLLVTNREGSMVAAIHAGWRGLLEGVIENTLMRMHMKPEETLVWCGPAISQRHFEVGIDVKEKFCSKHIESESAFYLTQNQTWFADIYALAKIRLNHHGIYAIYGGSHNNDYCTYSNEAHYFSYRRDGITGRMASLIWIAL